MTSRSACVSFSHYMSHDKVVYNSSVGDCLCTRMTDVWSNCVSGIENSQPALVLCSSVSFQSRPCLLWTSVGRGTTVVAGSSTRTCLVTMVMRPIYDVRRLSFDYNTTLSLVKRNSFNRNTLTRDF